MSLEKITHSSLFQIMNADIYQSLRSRWFWVYSILFGGFVAVMFATGITESQIIGFVGLSRLMVTFMQVSMVILPIYVLITTVRSVVGDRESNVMEYMLSLPVSFSGYFWGKFAAKFLVTYIPVFIALFGAALWGSLTKLDVPWDLFMLYSALLAAMIFCFLGISMFISAVAHSQDLAISSAFVLWLLLVAFLDLILMGLLLKLRLDAGTVIGIGMLNPLQVFRTAVLVLFDPDLTVMGAASYFILDTVSRELFIVFAIAYPILLGGLFGWLGNYFFNTKDIL
ncbi:MAG: ABC transporter permease [Lentimicrobium sp.]|jgi:ABC-2 type transport system permease protein|nr:ABC transporter permease [Lentimicrobium sp.]MDD2527072.1 ABC transporter permease subunit [Lentimicrobiaceae bacterium]MDD4598492.1 ABC transporter permease subunit [Lentimicrobiaceae bacterium]MDY0026282.1 ABC transporter permease subunit [Lentimicrobium sp.]